MDVHLMACPEESLITSFWRLDDSEGAYERERSRNRTIAHRKKRHVKNPSHIEKSVTLKTIAHRKKRQAENERLAQAVAP